MASVCPPRGFQYPGRLEATAPQLRANEAPWAPSACTWEAGGGRRPRCLRTGASWVENQRSRSRSRQGEGTPLHLVSRAWAGESLQRDLELSPGSWQLR